MSALAPAVAATGNALRRGRRVVAAVQWAMVACYAVLVTVPALLPLPASDARIVSDLRLFAQFAFWGVWWPFVIVSVMLLGRAWCGLLCPEGTLTEFASRHGLGRSIPRWLRWSGWPFVAFAGTTVYGQLISVYEYPQATLLMLGGSTVAAIAVGAIYGRGTRVWCRYLCPVSGVFGLLAKVAPLHFRTDAEAWRRHRGPPVHIDCAPLLDLRHLASASDCHACGRCAGHRGAISLAPRAPNREILQAAADSGRPASRYPARLLVFGMLGLALGAFQWSASPLFVALRQAGAQWLLTHGHDALLGDAWPWWLLTHHPDAGDVFNTLDGVAILAYLGLSTAVFGGSAWLALRLAARLCAAPGWGWQQLAPALVPIAGASLFLGLSMTTLSLLRAEGVVPAWAGSARSVLLAGALLWSAWLAARLLARATRSAPRRAGAWLVLLLPLGAIGASWVSTLRLG